MIILLSGGHYKDNASAFKKALKKPGKIGFIPSWYGNDCLKDFLNFKKEVGQKHSVSYFPLDKRINKKELLSCDVIFIDGGNTFFTHALLKKKRLLKDLIKFSNKKTIIGLSAGSILLTPNINLASIPKFNADDNLFKTNKFDALNLVPFEVYPHYTSGLKETLELTKYSKTHNRKIYLLKDGNYLIYKNKKLFFHKKPAFLENGILKK